MYGLFYIRKKLTNKAIQITRKNMSLSSDIDGIYYAYSTDNCRLDNDEDCIYYIYENQNGVKIKITAFDYFSVGFVDISFLKNQNNLLTESMSLNNINQNDLVYGFFTDDAR